MTNPTPLTAEDAEYQNMKKQKEAIEAKQGICLTGVTHSIYDQIVDEQSKLDEECLLEDIDNKLLEFAEAYAAQQNAELVAENERLKDHLTIEEAANNSERDEQQHIIFELKQQLAWQPIETAPKDGTLVWISGPKYNNRSLGAYLTDKYIEDNAIYNSNDDPLIAGWYEYQTGHPDYDEYWSEVKEPTLWQPVPASPQPPKEEVSEESDRVKDWKALSKLAHRVNQPAKEAT